MREASFVIQLPVLATESRTSNAGFLADISVWRQRFIYKCALCSNVNFGELLSHTSIIFELLAVQSTAWSIISCLASDKKVRLSYVAVDSQTLLWAMVTFDGQVVPHGDLIAHFAHVGCTVGGELAQ